MSDFKTKMHQIRCPLWFYHRHRWWSLQRSPSSRIAVVKGPTSKGEGRREKNGKGKVKGGEGKGSTSPSLQSYFDH